MKYSINRMTYEQAAEIISWKYEAPYDFYDMGGIEEEIDAFLGGTYYYVSDLQNKLIGYFCFGAEAQVPTGWDFGAYDAADVLDIGLGMHPDLCGHGMGREFLQLGMDFASEQFHINSFRLTVADFNQRAIKVYERAGYKKVSSFERIAKLGPIIFHVMIRH